MYVYILQMIINHNVIRYNDTSDLYTMGGYKLILFLWVGRSGHDNVRLLDNEWYLTFVVK